MEWLVEERSAGQSLFRMSTAKSAPSWSLLTEHHALIQDKSLHEWFAEDSRRGTRWCVNAAGLYLDYSKQRIDAKAMHLLVKLAVERGLRPRIAAMFSGVAINTSEDRAALHTALRAPDGVQIWLDGVDVVAHVHAVLKRMAKLSEEIRSGCWRGHSGKRIRHVINIGIGGSDLGPAMAHEALKHYSHREISVHFVSNIDSTSFAEATRGLDAEETLFIICSKTMKTAETLINARFARDWCLRKLVDPRAVARHFVAATENLDAAAAFGIAKENVFPIWEWVGGRYGLPSAIGLSTMIAVGENNFHELLVGMRTMDLHFTQAPINNNMPAIMGLLAVWNTNFLGAETQAVLPYEQYLSRFPAYIQQLVMESNGKCVTRDGQPVGCSTSPIVWGEPGTNGQHSFHQLLHQGTRLVPCDFIGFAWGLNPNANEGRLNDRSHDLLIANMFSQAEALAFGEGPEALRAKGVRESLIPHRVLGGNRPSNTLLAGELTPRTLGALVALYEHSVFTQGVIWGINSFDQWGVERGKNLAARMCPEMEGDSAMAVTRDSSTSALIQHYRHLRLEGHSAG